MVPPRMSDGCRADDSESDGGRVAQKLAHATPIAVLPLCVFHPEKSVLLDQEHTIEEHTSNDIVILI